MREEWIQFYVLRLIRQDLQDNLGFLCCLQHFSACVNIPELNKKTDRFPVVVKKVVAIFYKFLNSIFSKEPVS